MANFNITNPQLTHATADIMRDAIYDVWDQIAADAIVAIEGVGGEEMDNAQAIEMCLDADRLSEFGHHDAEALYDALCAIHGYEVVDKFLNDHIHLM